MESSPTYKVLVADPISQLGVDALAATPGIEVTFQTGLSEDEIVAMISDYSAIVVRSQTKVTPRIIEAAPKLKAIGRAGVGVDNVDIEAATQRGIVVMNTPGGNTISTAEHAFSLLVSTARNIPQAHGSMVAGRWDRKLFAGVELYNKTLTVLGMGRIGTEVARRAIAFGMRVIAYDPYLSASRAKALQVELVEDLDDAVNEADFITLHMPLTPETKHMLDATRIAKIKQGVRIINCARGGLVEEQALMDALNSGHVAAAALDVYEDEPPAADCSLRSTPNLIMTPHLGASTAEAQESVGIEIAETIKDTLIDGTIRNAVNTSSLDKKTIEQVGPYIELGEKLGVFLSQTRPNHCETLTINYSGKISEGDTTPITRAILKGFLTMLGDEVNVVNAPSKAEALGLKVVETRNSATTDFSEQVELTASAGEESATVIGTFFGTQPKIVKINDRHLEARPQGVLLLLENKDRPGIVGHLGSILADHDVNIASMSLSRASEGGRALTVLNLDTAPNEKLLATILEDEDIYSAKAIAL